MRKFIISILLLINMIAAKPGIGTQLRGAIYNIDLHRSPNGQLSEFLPSAVKSLTTHEIGFKNPNQKRTIKITTRITKLSHSYKYFSEFCYDRPICREISIDLGSAVTAITELQDERIVCGSEEGLLKVITAQEKIDACIQFESAINGIIELNCSSYCRYIAVLLGEGIALINPVNFEYTVFTLDEDIQNSFSLIGFQELRNGPLKGKILICQERGLIIFDPINKKFFQKIDHDLLEQFIENSFFEDNTGDFYFITEDFNLINFSLDIDSEIINIQSESIIPAISDIEVYRYILNKKGLIAFSLSLNDKEILENNVFIDYRGNFPQNLNNATGMINSIIFLKDGNRSACLVSALDEARHLKIFHSSRFKVETIIFSELESPGIMTQLKEGNLAIGLDNGNISICTFYNPNLKNLSIHQIALLVNLIKASIKASTRPSCGPLPPLYMHPEWHDIFITLPEVYQNRFKDMIATVDHSQESSLLSKNSHPNPGEQNQDAKRTFPDEPNPRNS